MKNAILMIVVVMLGLAACSGPQAATLTPPASDGVQVYYFHGKQRCVTCNAIEQLAAEVVKSLDDSAVTYSVVDISTEEGRGIAANFEVASSALVLCQWRDGQLVNHQDLTNMAFASARSNPEGFKESLTAEIRKLQ